MPERETEPVARPGWIDDLALGGHENMPIGPVAMGKHHAFRRVKSDVAGPCEPEWRRRARPSCEQDNGDERGKQQDHHGDERRDAACGPEARGRCRPRPTVEHLPARATLGLSDLPDDVVEEPVGRETRPLRFEPGCERPVEIGLHRHAIPSRSNGTTRLSASMAARIVFVPRWSRDFAVPTGMPSMSAIAASGNPSR